MATAAARFLLRHRSTTLHVRPLCSAAPEPSVHPWPEWDRFVHKLSDKGYFEKKQRDDADADAGDGGVPLTAAGYYTRAKVACLGFARERPDLLRSLSKKDIQAIVECGCPNLLRKSVNSAKRLRAYLKLDEGDVCSSCNLRGTCDRAYVMAKEDEGARTVDIVRILFQYAADSFGTSSEEKPPLNPSIGESARKLLSELINLSETTPDPDIVKAITKPNIRDLHHVAKVWETNPNQNTEMKRGDWICHQCNFMNYARNLRCLQCKADGPKRVGYESPEIKKGDWSCPRCQFMNFARNTACRECQESRPARQLEPGEWECPRCNFLNFRRNKACLKCKHDHPENESGKHDGAIQRRPRFSPEAPGSV